MNTKSWFKTIFYALGNGIILFVAEVIFVFILSFVGIEIKEKFLFLLILFAVIMSGTQTKSSFRYDSFSRKISFFLISSIVAGALIIIFNYYSTSIFYFGT